MNLSKPEGEADAGIAGIIRNGSYISTHQAGERLQRMVDLNGSGMVRLWHAAQANTSLSGTQILAGTMSGQQQLILGDDSLT